MKSALILCFGLFYANIFWAQDGKQVYNTNTLQNIERYKIDFEVLEFGSNPDTAYVNALPLHEYEIVRLHNEDNKVFDLANGYTIILYSYEKAAIRKAEHQANKEK